MKIRQYDLMSSQTMRLVLQTHNHYFHTLCRPVGSQQHSKYEFEADSTFHFEFDSTEQIVVFQLELKGESNWKTIGMAELNMMQGNVK